MNQEVRRCTTPQNNPPQIRDTIPSERRECPCLGFEFDREGRAKIGSLRDRASHQEISWKGGHSQRIEERAAARVSHHRMFGAVESIFAFQLAQIRDVLELAIAERRLRRKRPVATRLRRRSRRQPDEQRRNIFSREPMRM